MCGIVGYVGPRQAEPILLESLSRLEYRGYDSAGIATLYLEPGSHAHRTQIRRAVGKLENLKKIVAEKPCEGSVGIGHTRWATHGRPTETNAHPHLSEHIAVVHNGIIENHYELKEALGRQGRVFHSDTDTEVIAHLVALEKKQASRSFTDAVRAALSHVRGAFALAVLDEQTPDTLVCVKQACPLIIGLGEDENFIGSDFPALLPYTRNFIILEEGDVAEVKRHSVVIFDAGGKKQMRPVVTLDWSPLQAEKEGFRHFMLKEIHEQPRAVIDTLRGRVQQGSQEITLEGLHVAKLEGIQRIHIVACGSSFHAGMIAKHAIEDLAKVPVELELASEFRYRDVLLDEHTLVIGISQSGETADTLAALKHARSKNAPLMAICNALESAIPRLCAPSVGTLYTRAGPEISVASTKAFMTQIVALHIFALGLASLRGKLTPERISEEIASLSHLPVLLENALTYSDEILSVAKRLAKARDMLFLGRGVLFPIALEGALKMKELSYIHAEGYASGEMKHGPIALIDEDMPVIVLAMKDETYEKSLSNLEEVKTRGGQIVALCDEGDVKLRSSVDLILPAPSAPKHLLAAVATIPMQLLAYFVADLRGLDVDQPRNLAKSVTVE